MKNKTTFTKIPLFKMPSEESHSTAWTCSVTAIFGILWDSWRLKCLIILLKTISFWLLFGWVLLCAPRCQWSTSKACSARCKRGGIRPGAFPEVQKVSQQAGSARKQGAIFQCGERFEGGVFHFGVLQCCIFCTSSNFFGFSSLLGHNLRVSKHTSSINVVATYSPYCCRRLPANVYIFE